LGRLVRGPAPDGLSIGGGRGPQLLHGTSGHCVGRDRHSTGSRAPPPPSTASKSPYKCRYTTHTHPFNGPFSGTTPVSWYQKGKTNLDFTEARGSEWQWHRLGHMQVCTSLQTDNHTSTPPLSFLQPGCPSCRPTNSVKALKA